jgi:short-subunit dehydrogenase
MNWNGKSIRNRQNDMNIRYALITGASSGIGMEFAYIAAEKGMHLILVARNAEKLMQLRKILEDSYGIKVLAVGCDLAQPDAPEKINSLLESRNITPDVLINNAGFGLFGFFDHTSPEKEENMLQVNIVSLTMLTKLVYRKMRKRNSGYILNVASIAGFMPGPLMAVYYASKAYVCSFSAALANEAKGSGVHVTALCPGPTNTNFEANATAAGNSKLFKSFRRLGKLPDGKQVARYGWKAMMNEKTIAIHGKKNRLTIFLIRFLPRNTLTNMVRNIQNPVEK